MTKLTHSAREVIGQFLEERRKELNLSYYQLHQATGLHNNQIKSVFKGDTNYTIDSLLLLSDPLKLYLFFGSKEGKKNIPLDVKHMIKQIEKSDPEL